MKTANMTPDRGDLEAELDRLHRFLVGRVATDLSDSARLVVAADIVKFVRIRLRLGRYDQSRQKRDLDFVRDLALPTPN